MSREVFYVTIEERNKAIQFARSKGEQLYHDDFNQGENGENRLTFDVPSAPIPDTPEQTREKALLENLKARSMTLPELLEFMELKFGL